MSAFWSFVKGLLRKQYRGARRPHGRHRRAALFTRLRFEALELRWLPSTFVVTNTGDSSVLTSGSLRAAILNANASPGSIINFNIGASGVVETITPASALPAITASVTIDGTTEAGYTSSPLINLNGAGLNANGLQITASNATIRGLAVGGFGQAGLLISGGVTGDLITNDFVGTNAAGTAAAANAIGIEISSSANNTLNTDLISGNTGNGVTITGSGSTGNVVVNCEIGTNAAGTAALGNGADGVDVENGASGNTIGAGTSQPVTTNLALWLNADQGVTTNSSGQVTGWTDQSGNNHNGAVQGSGLTLVQNALNGQNAVQFSGSGDLLLSGQVLTSQQYTILAVVTDTHTDTNFHEVFSDWSSSNGITSVFLGTTNNAPDRARFTDYMGGAEDPNHTQTGVGSVTSPTQPFVLTGVSSTSDGSIYQDQTLIADKGSAIPTRNLTYAYYVGDQGSEDGEFWQGDISELLVYNGALSQAQLSTDWSYLDAKYLPNVISGNAGGGVNIHDSGTTGNVVEGNKIGTNASGTSAVANGYGVYVQNGASSNTIGGTAAAARNIISGNNGVGVWILNAGNDNAVQGNYIGTNATGSAAVTTTAYKFTAVSGSEVGQVAANIPQLSSTTTATVSFWMNWDGTTNGGIGEMPIGFHEYDLWLQDGDFGFNTGNGDVYGISDPANLATQWHFVTAVFVNGAVTQDQLWIDGVQQTLTQKLGTAGTGTITTQADLSGWGISTSFRFGGELAQVAFFSQKLTAAQIQADYSAGTSATYGDTVRSQGAVAYYPLTEMSGSVAADASGNGNNGTISSSGVTPGGAAGPLGGGNGYWGVEVESSPSTTIGGTAAGAGNAISGNGEGGIAIYGSGSVGNLVEGNTIGLNAAGTAALANDDSGVYAGTGAYFGITSGADSGAASGTTIGGTTTAARNIISGNGNVGVWLVSDNQTTADGGSNVVEGNYIGTNAAGNAAVPNTSWGVEVNNSPNNTIGGTISGAGNVISGNSGGGVGVYGTNAVNNTVQGNVIGLEAPTAGNSALANVYAGIYVGAGADFGITSGAASGVASATTIGGTTALGANTISSNDTYGIRLADGTAGDVIQGNNVGTNTTGSVLRDNTLAAIQIDSGSAQCSAGTLVVDGAIAGGGTFTIASGATLSTASAATDALSITATAFVDAGTINVAGGGTVTLASSGGSFTFNAGASESGAGLLLLASGTLNVNANVSVQNLSVAGGTLTGAATVTVTGQTTWTGGTMSGTGSTVAKGGLSLNSDSNYLILDTRTLENAGSAVYSGVGYYDFEIDDGATVLNDAKATWSFQTTELTVYTAAGAVGTFNNAGLLKSASGSGNDNELYDITFTSTGTVEIDSGVFYLDDTSGTISGAMTVAASATLDLYYSSNITLAAGASESGAGTLEVDGSATVASNTSVQNVLIEGTLTANGNLAVGGTLSLDYGTLTGSGTVTVTGQTTWTDGTMSGSGSTVADGGLALNSDSFLELSGRRLENAGSAVSSADYDLYVTNSAAIVNDAGATWNFQDNAELYGDGTGTFSNAGLLEQSIGSSTTYIDIPFSNTGTVEITVGTLYLDGTFTNFANNTLTGGTYFVHGTLQFNSANIVTNAANITLDGSAAAIVDQNGNNALANFTTNSSAGSFTVQNGAIFGVFATFVNSGSVTVGANGNFNTVPTPTEWASSVIGYSSERGTSSWSAAQATGAPNVSGYGDSTSAWSPASENGTLDYLTLGYATPLHATGVDIRETWGNGFVTRIDLLDTTGTYHTVWTGTDPSQSGEPFTFFTDFPATSYLVQGVKLYVDTSHNLSTYEEIDAVGLFDGTLTAYDQTGGTTTLNGGTLSAAGQVVLAGGTLTGSGSVYGNVVNSGGQVAPGLPVGTLSISDGYTQQAGGSLNLDISGPAPGTGYDQLSVGGPAVFGGTINVNRPGGYTPPSGSLFQVVSYASSSGDFATKNGFSLGNGQSFQEQITANSLNLLTNQALLAFQAPLPNVTAGQTFAPVQVAILGANGNILTTDNSDQITLSINQGTLHGTLTQTVVKGIATFPDLSVTAAGSGYELSAAVSGITGAISNLFTVSPNTATHLVYLVQPSNIVFGSDIFPEVRLALEDAYSNVETGDSSTPVTLTLASNPTGAVLTGTNPVTDTFGVANFGVLTVSKAGTGYTLQASAPGLPALTSSAFNVTPLGTTTTLPYSFYATYNSASQPVTLSATVTAANSAVTVNEGTVTFTVNNGSAVVGSPITVNVVNGIATGNYVLPGGTPSADYGVTAVYNPGPEFSTSSASTTLAVNPASATATGASVTVTFSTSSQNVPVTATVTSPAGTVSEGIVTFYVYNSDGDLINGTVYGAVSNGAASATYVLPAATPAGSYSLWAYFNSAQDFGYSLDSSHTLTVNSGGTVTTAANASVTFSTAAQNVTLKATVTSPAGVVNEGTETFTVLNGSAVVGTPVTANVVSGAVSVSYGVPAGQGAGTYTIKAVYNGGPDFLGNSDSTHTLTVNAANTTTTATSVTVPFSPAAQNVSLTATVTSAAGVVNEGEVTFYVVNGSQDIGNGVSANVVQGTATATYTLPAATPGGTYTIQAYFSFSSDYNASNDTSHTFTVNSGGTVTTAANASATYSTSAQNVTLSATVTNPAGTVNAGTETFTVLSSGAVLGNPVTVNVVNGAASATYSLPAATVTGTYTIQAVYNGSANFLGNSDSTHTLTVNPAPTTTTAANASTAYSPASQNVSLSAAVTSSGGVVNEGAVTFTVLSGSTVIGSPVAVGVSSGAASATYTLPAGTAGGTYTIQAAYSDTDLFYSGNFAASTDSSHTLTVTAMPTTTTAANASTTYAVGSQSVSLGATVTSALGAVSGGTATFTILSGSTAIGSPVTVNVSSGAASASYTLPGGTAAGSYTIEAAYNGTTIFAPSTDTTHTLFVGAAPTTTTAANATVGYNQASQAVSLSATVTSPGGTVNEGTATFAVLSGSTVIGSPVTVNVSGGAASAGYTLPAGTGLGSYTIQAAYNGTAEFVSSTDTSHTLTVTAAPTTTTATSASATYAVGGQSVYLYASVTSAGAAVNQGTATFTLLSGNTVVGSPVTVNVSSGAAPATYTLPAGTAVGPYTIQAVYNGTAFFAGSSDTSHSLTVKAAFTTTSAANTLAGYSAASQTVSLSASVISPAGTVNEGTETFTLLSGGTVIGSPVAAPVIGGVASANYTLPAGTVDGTYTIQAVTTDPANFLGSSDASHVLTVGPNATTTAAVSAFTDFSAAAQTVALSASVTSSVATVNEGSVTFTVLNGATVIGTPVTASVVNGSAGVNYALPAGLADGIYTIQAAYSGTAHFAASTDSSQDLLVDTIVWVSATSGSWDDPSNWLPNRLPRATDEVVIPETGLTVTKTGGSIDVLSLNSQAALSLSGVSLTVTSGASQVGAALTMTGGSALTTQGAGTTFTATGATAIDGTSVSATGGAQVSLPGVTSWNETGGAESLSAQSGGVISLPNLTTVSVTGSGSTANLLADGAGSLLNVPVLTTVSGTSGLTASHQGSIDAPLLTSLDGTAVTLDGTGTLPTAQIGTLTDGQLTVSGGSYDFSGLSHLDNSGVSVSGGITVSLPDVTSYQAGSGTLQASGTGSVLSLPNVTVLTDTAAGDTGSVKALSGGEVTLPALDAVTVSAGSTVGLLADGSGSLLNLPALLGISGPSSLSATRDGTIVAPLLTGLSGTSLLLDGTGTLPTAQIASLTGGQLNLGAAYNFGGLTDIDGSSVLVSGGTSESLPGVTGYQPGTATLQASGSGSVLKLSNLTQLSETAGATLSVSALAGGEVSLPALTTLTVSGSNAVAQLSADGTNSALDLPALTSLDATGAATASFTLGDGAVADVSPSGLAVTGAVVNVGSGSTLTGPLTLDAGSILAGQGTIQGNVVNTAGTLAPDDPRRIYINGDYHQGPNGTLDLEIEGTTPGTLYDQVVISGTAYLDGTLSVTYLNGYLPQLADTYQVMTYAAVVGDFANFQQLNDILTEDLTPSSLYLVADTIAVTTTADSGGGSLRQAITTANNRPQATLIYFAIPGSGVQKIITPMSPLPTVTAQVIIDGTTQAGYAGTPVILINGSASGDDDGLVLTAARSTVRGLAIGGFRNGIVLSGGGNDVVKGNYLGVDAGGASAFANSASGLVLDDSDDNTVTGNVIGANGGNGIALLDGSDGNVVQGNWVGTTPAGGVLGNGGAGVRLADSSNNQVGGPAPGQGNTIANNGDAGIAVTGTSVGDALRGNVLSGNGGPGIDLGDNGHTPNDSLGHTGPNDYLDFPVLTGATLGQVTVVQGQLQLQSALSATFTLDFYASPVTEPGGGARASVYLGSAQVSTDSTGLGKFNDPFGTATTAGEYVTATATDAAGDTSELADPLQGTLYNPPPGVTITGPGSIHVGPAVAFGSQVTDAASGHTFTYLWSVKEDGNPSFQLPDTAVVAEPNFTFTPATVGTYHLTLVVTDNLGEVGQGSFTLGVTPQPVSVAVTGGPTYATPFTTITLTGTVETPPGTSLTGAPVWSATLNGQPFPLPPGGTDSAGRPTLSFVVPAPGNYAVRLGAVNNTGGMGAGTFTVGVSNGVEIVGPPETTRSDVPLQLSATVDDPNLVGPLTYDWSVTHDGSPFASQNGADPTFSFAPDLPGTFAVTVAVTDANGHTVSASASTVVPDTLAILDLPDRAFTGESVTLEATGFLPSPASSVHWAVFNAAGHVVGFGTGASFTYVPTDPGLDLITLTCPGQATSATLPIYVASVTVTLTAPPSPAQGSPVTLTADLGGTSAGATYTYAWTVTDSNGQTVASGPGTVVSPTRGTFTFTPALPGTYGVKLTVLGSDFSYAAATSSFGVTDVPPTVTLGGLPAGAVPEGTFIHLVALANDAGGTADVLRFAWTLTGPDGFSQTGSNSTLDFVPIEGGAYPVTVTVTDSNGESATLSTSITVTHVQPVAVISSGPATHIDPVTGIAVIEAVANVPDPGSDGDNFQYTWLVTDDTQGGAVVGQQSPGATNSPSFTFSGPSADNYTLTLRVTDGGDATVTVPIWLGVSSSVTLTNANVPAGSQVLAVAFNGAMIDASGLSDQTGFVGVALGSHDTLIGGAGNNVLQGDSGFNSLVGGSGNDTMYATGGDTLVGGTGNGTDLFALIPPPADAPAAPIALEPDALRQNTLSFAQAATGVSFNAALTGGQDQNLATGDSVELFGAVQQVIGSAGNDSLVAGDGMTLFGGGGNDTLTASGVSDVTLVAGSQADLLSAQASADVTLFGTGNSGVTPATGTPITLFGCDTRSSVLL